MSVGKETILRQYPDYTKVRVGEVGFSDVQIERFVWSVFGMYFNPLANEQLHGVFTELLESPKSKSNDDQNRYRDFLIYNFARVFSNIFGLIMPNPPKVRPEEKIYPRNKFEELAKLSKIWEASDPQSRHAATIGGYDSPHPFHLIHQRLIYPYSSRIMVGIDPNWLLAERKGSDGDERPRYPHLLTRMWQFACIPMVDVVFELPIEPGEKIGNRMPEIWDALNVTLLGTEPDHQYLDAYQRQMQARGGAVMTTRNYPAWAKWFMIRSTQTANNLSHLSFHKVSGPDEWHEIMAKREEKIARKIGMRFGK